jgi:hypothetical protein
VKSSKAQISLVAAGILLLVVWAGGALLSWGSCSWYGYQTERNTRYAAFVGCMVKVNDGWIPRKELRVVQ